MTRSWVTFTCWTGEASLSGYDTDEVLHIYPDEAAARAAQHDDAEEYLGTVRPEHERYPDWCCGVGVAPEPEPNHAPNGSEADIIAADHVPQEFFDLLEAKEKAELPGTEVQP